MAAAGATSSPAQPNSGPEALASSLPGAPRGPTALEVCYDLEPPPAREPASQPPCGYCCRAKLSVPLPFTARPLRTFLAPGTWPQTQRMWEAQALASRGCRARVWHRWALAAPAPPMMPAQGTRQGGGPGAAADEGGGSGRRTPLPTGASWQPRPRPGARPCPAPVVIGGGCVGRAAGLLALGTDGSRCSRLFRRKNKPAWPAGPFLSPVYVRPVSLCLKPVSCGLPSSEGLAAGLGVFLPGCWAGPGRCFPRLAFSPALGHRGFPGFGVSWVHREGVD